MDPHYSGGSSGMPNPPQTFSLTWTPKAPKYTSGCPLKIYFELLEDFFETAQIPEGPQRASIFKAGLPPTEYARFCSGATLPYKFEDLKAELLSKFEPAPSSQLLQAEFHAVAQRPGETAVLFLDRLRRLCAQAYPELDHETRETLVSGQFRRNLRSERVRQAALLSSTFNLDLLAGELVRYEAVFQGEPTENVSAIVARAREGLEKKVDDLAQQLTQLASRLDRLTLSGATARSGAVRWPPLCWNCGCPGHLARECERPATACRTCNGCHPQRFFREGR